VDGVLDLRDWDFRSRRSLRLVGTWEFWPGILATPDQVAPDRIAAGALPPPALLAVPGVWPRQQVDGRPLPPEGIGTYRLRVLLPPDAPALALRQYQRFIAWEVLVDGQPTLAVGTVGADAGSTDTVGQRALAAIDPPGGEMEIIVRMAAFGGYGGIPVPLELGPAEDLYGAWMADLAWRSGFSALCLALGVIYLALFFMRPRDRECLAFAVMSLSFVGVQVTFNTPFGLTLMGAFPSQLIAPLSNFMFPGVWLGALALARTVLPGTLPWRWMMPAILLVCAVPFAGLVTVDFPNLLRWTAIGAVVTVLLTVAVMTGRAMRRSVPLAWPMAAALGLIGATNLALLLGLADSRVVVAGYTVMLTVQAILLVDRIRRMLDEARTANGRLTVMNQTLEGQVEERTAHLTQALGHLHATKDRLVQSEKLASLGRLVAGVAHEINTPVGIALTASSHLRGEVERMRGSLAANAVSRTAFTEFIATAGETAGLLSNSAERTAELVRQFKQLVAAPDEERSRFDLSALLAETASYAHQLGAPPVAVTAPDGLLLDSYPATLAGVLEELIANTVDHGYPDRDSARDHGRITIHARANGGADTGGGSTGGEVEIIYADGGSGVRADITGRLFEPFVTTRRGEGRAGLGLHRVHTLVEGRLGGRIRLEPAEESLGDRTVPGSDATVADAAAETRAPTGARFVLTLPITAPVPAEES
jgi:signal transduction histidine kinase